MILASVNPDISGCVNSSGQRPAVHVIYRRADKDVWLRIFNRLCGDDCFHSQSSWAPSGEPHTVKVYESADKKSTSKSSCSGRILFKKCDACSLSCVFTSQRVLPRGGNRHSNRLHSACTCSAVGEQAGTFSLPALSRKTNVIFGLDPIRISHFSTALTGTAFVLCACWGRGKVRAMR